MKNKFKIEQKVVYDGILAEVTEIYYNPNKNVYDYGLTAVDNEKLMCMAREDRIEIYDENTFDEDKNKEAISNAVINNSRISKMVDNLTEKYKYDKEC